MRKLLLGAAFALAATTATAGSIEGPVVEQDVIIEMAPTSSINHHLLPPLFFVLAVGTSMILL